MSCVSDVWYSNCTLEKADIGIRNELKYETVVVRIISIDFQNLCTININVHLRSFTQTPFCQAGFKNDVYRTLFFVIIITQDGVAISSVLMMLWRSGLCYLPCWLSIHSNQCGIVIAHQGSAPDTILSVVGIIVFIITRSSIFLLLWDVKLVFQTTLDFMSARL